MQNAVFAVKSFVSHGCFPSVFVVKMIHSTEGAIVASLAEPYLSSNDIPPALAFSAAKSLPWSYLTGPENA